MIVLRNLAMAAALVAASAAAPVFASEATPDTWLQQAASSHSRADVAAELAAFGASGQARVFSAGYIEPPAGSRLRAEVRADTLRAIAGGEVAAINSQARDSLPTAQAQRLAQLVR